MEKEENKLLTKISNSRITAVAIFIFIWLITAVVAKAMSMSWNYPPALYFPNENGYDNIDGVSPNISHLSSLPIFKIIFSDYEGDEPIYVKLVIDGISYEMSPDVGQGADYLSGVQYATSAPSGILSAGMHSYHFEASDWQYSVRYPENDELYFELKNDPVIIIPGILGSEQKNGVWVIDPILHTYDNLIDTFKANGFVDDVNLFTFPYQWRQSNVLSAFELHQKVNEVKEICNCEKVDLVAHSMGGLVARQYIQSNYYENDVDQLIFLGTPHLGAPKAYLAWEAGEFPPGVSDGVLKLWLTLEAKKSGYTSLFNYIQGGYVSSVKELLPIYDYLRDKDSGVLRAYPTNYPHNNFLEELNNNFLKTLNSGIRLTNIVGDSGDVNTIKYLRVITSQLLPLWQDGYPEGFKEKIGDLGLETSAGDKTVPIYSSSYINDDLTILSSEHTNLPTKAESIIINKITNITEPSTINKWQIPNLKILIIKILSPADIVVISPDGKRIGKNFATGEEINELDGAFYSGFETDNEFISIPNPLDGEYKIQAEGTGEGGEYTLAVGYITDGGLFDDDYTSNIEPDSIKEHVIYLGNSKTENIIITPTDNIPPIIEISSPLAKDYIRTNNIMVAVTSTDIESGIAWQQLMFDDKLTSNNNTIDLFKEKLGKHHFTATASDLAGNTAIATVSFRLIATATSTIQDIERMFSLGWIKNKQTKNYLIGRLKLIAQIEKTAGYINSHIYVGNIITTKILEILYSQFLKDLYVMRDKQINEQAYYTLSENINWILKN